MGQANPDRDIAVIGGGISGITTAVLLQLAGYRTTLHTQAQPFPEPDAERPAEFATLHAAASMLPHSVASPQIAHWIGISQHFFRALCFPGWCGVRNQLHYEIAEDPIESMPPYAGSVENFILLNESECDQPWVPKRSGAGATYGWQFDMFFCENPLYLRFLYDLYAAIGGRLRSPPAGTTLTAYLQSEPDVLVNCTGIGAPALLGSLAGDPQWTDDPLDAEFEPLIDAIPPKLIRGHYLRIAVNAIPTGQRGRFFSYNYKPVAEIYRTAAGLPADVYCYPRSDAWLLGGSRQEGRLDAAGDWIGEPTIGPELEVPRPNAPPLAIPTAVLQLNADILLRLSNGRIDLERLTRDHPELVSPGIGYRFVRDSDSDSIRLGCSRLRGSGSTKYVLHNYGHGGSGFALSWGCAFDVLRSLRRIDGATGTFSRPAGRAKFATGHAAIHALLTEVIARLIEADPTGPGPQPASR